MELHKVVGAAETHPGWIIKKKIGEIERTGEVKRSTALLELSLCVGEDGRYE
jgi:hypothetical protein